MNRSLIGLTCTVGLCCVFVEQSNAAVVQTPGLVSVSAVLDGGLIGPNDVGDTLDYLLFDVLSTSSVTVTSAFDASYQLWLAGYLGVDHTFEYIFITEPDLHIPFGQSRAFPLMQGTYVAVMGIRELDENQFYNTDFGFRAVNPLGGGFTFGDYGYSLGGDVRAIEFREGNLNGTFTVTPIPEPDATVVGILGWAAVTVCRRRRPL